MKNIEVNNDDYSFENSITFNKLIEMHHQKTKENIIIGSLIGSIILSSGTIYKVGKDILETKEYNESINKIFEEVDDTITKQNDEIIKRLIDSTILITNSKTSIPLKYYFENDKLYDMHGSQIFLDKTNLPIFFISCNLSNELLDNIKLSSSPTKALFLDNSSVDDNLIDYLPTTLTELSLTKCNYITNLNKLPHVCPNIEKLFLNNMPELSDLSFLYDMPNLKEVYLKESAYITEELLSFLNSKNIITNISSIDIENNRKTDEIITEIIKPDMTDLEKIQAISMYVFENIEYDASTTIESNDRPLTYALNKKGVCASYAYLTSVLLNKANIESFEITSDEHGWNIVNIDNKYYYLDTTNLSNNLFDLLFKKLNISNNYLANPQKSSSEYLKAVTDESVIIPDSLVNEIINSDYHHQEKYSALSKAALMFTGILSGLIITSRIKRNKVLEKSKSNR